MKINKLQSTALQLTPDQRKYIQTQRSNKIIFLDNEYPEKKLTPISLLYSIRFIYALS